jgi:hypothetical protein
MTTDNENNNSETDKTFDDLEAFFKAATSENTDAMNEAAQKVVDAAQPGTEDPTNESPRQTTSRKNKAIGLSAPDKELVREAYRDMDGKFIALDPEKITGSTKEPFILVPAHVHTLLPWWAWVTIAMSFIMLIVVWVIMPSLFLDRLTARLGDENPSTAQSVMRQLVMKGDRETVEKLFGVAASQSTAMTVRLRAVDTLSLIGASDADRALLRLELANETDAEVKDAAIAARKQREAYRNRNR